MAYYIETEAGERYGPADAARLSQWYAEGRIRANWLVIDSSSGSRLALEQIIQIPDQPEAGNKEDSIVAPPMPATAETSKLQEAAGPMGDPLYIVIHPGGQQFGPVSADVLLQWLHEGRVMPAWLVADSVSRRQMSVIQALAFQTTGHPPEEGLKEFLEMKSKNPNRLLALIVGYVSLGASLTFWLSPLGLIGSIVAIVLGYKSDKVDPGTGRAPINCGWIAIVLSIVLTAALFFFLFVLHGLTQTMNSL